MLKLSCRWEDHSVIIILSCFCRFISSQSSSFACKLNKRLFTWGRKSQDVVPDMSRFIGQLKKSQSSISRKGVEVFPFFEKSKEERLVFLISYVEETADIGVNK